MRTSDFFEEENLSQAPTPAPVDAAEIALDQSQDVWMRTTRFVQDANALAMIRVRVIENHSVEGGYVSPSSFERAYLELVAEGAIDECREKADAILAEATRPRLTAKQYNKLLSSVVQAKYKTDAQFRADVDELIAGGKV